MRENMSHADWPDSGFLLVGRQTKDGKWMTETLSGSGKSTRLRRRICANPGRARNTGHSARAGPSHGLTDADAAEGLHSSITQYAQMLSSLVTRYAGANARTCMGHWTAVTTTSTTSRGASDAKLRRPLLATMKRGWRCGDH